MTGAVETDRFSLRAWYLIAVLTLAYTASFVDRQVLNLLVGPIKADLKLSDTQLSLLQGLAFTLAYVAMSPLFGRLADTGNRRRILLCGIALWSVATIVCGLARGYRGLFLARMGVGGAEASLSPAAWSIITDSFPPALLPRAFSIFLMGPYLGGGLALIFGGLLLGSAESWALGDVPLLGALAPWQLVFVAVGAPGVLIAVLLGFVREPVRKASPVESERAAMTLREVAAIFRERRDFYLNFYLGMACLVISLYAFPAWIPAVLMRRFGASPAEVGVDYGALVLVTGSLGVLSGPLFARMAGRGGRPAPLLLVAFAAALLLVPTSLALFWADSYGAVLAIATLASFIYSVPQALAASALQLVTPNRMRGVATAVYVFAVSVIGLGAAPTLVAIITDRVLGDELRVGESLGLACGGAAALAAWFLWRAMAGFRRIMGAAEG